MGGGGTGLSRALELQQDLEDEFELAGWPGEGRKFLGHLTLCRIHNAKAGELLGQAAGNMGITISKSPGRPRSVSSRVN